MQAQQLTEIANELRIWIIEMLTEAKSGHPGGSLSAIDLVTALFFHEMKGITPEQKSGVPTPGPLPPHRDRFVLSKGHAVPALYAVLAKQGWIAVEELKTLRKTGSRLQGHPDRVRMPIVEASTGSLGQGLSVAQGIALGLKTEHPEARVFCLLGDGETQEGQIWEAAMSAPKFELSNLCAILDSNNGQIDGPVSQVMPLEPIADKWRAFGWHVIEIEGHNMTQIIQALKLSRDLHQQGGKKPVFILAKTIKGKGVSFMENNIAWHGVVPTLAEAEKAIQELKSELKKGGKIHG